jgi:anti-sigma B factor antagonist
MGKEKKKKMILNLFDTIYVDGSGIGEMVSAFTKLSNLGGSLKLLGLSKRVMDLLEATKLDTLFQIFEDEAEAVESFR